MNRLVRSSTDKMFAGVCGGLARYFGIDSTIVRLVFALAVLSGLSPLIYVILWIVMPEEVKYTAQPPVAQPYPMAQPQLPQPHPMAQQGGPTGEWKFDPYTGQPVQRREQ